MPTADSKAARRDVTRNRARIIAAARDVFAEQGITAANEAIIAAAGVGPSTFYRHFPARTDLFTAVLHDLAAAATDVARRAESITDPWEAFADVFTRGCVLPGPEVALFYAIAATSPEATELANAATARIVEPVLTRARAAGVIDHDLDVGTVVDLMSAAHTAPTPQRRHTRAITLLTGLRQPGRQESP